MRAEDREGGCPALVSVAAIQQLRGGKCLFQFTLHVTVHHWGKLGQKLKQRLKGRHIKEQCLLADSQTCFNEYPLFLPFFLPSFLP